MRGIKGAAIRGAFAELLVGALFAAGPLPGTAQIEEVVVVGDLDSLPDENVQSVFGFPKSLLHTPRSVSSISEEMIARFDMRDIDELIAVTPGSFTQSFFGVAGSLDIRGTPGETYFRGMRRLDNPGNYPTPIGASDRIDIVRGPPSPIHGPAKIGGFLNFYPKSARIEESGEFIGAATGTAALSTGNWNKRILSAEVGGPGRLGTQDYGYWLYAEAENSDSYYRDSSLDQTLLQASFDADLGERLQVQFGGMVHAYLGNEVAGWNRLTQQLVDRGIYITGQPRPLDRDGDGRISHQEFDLDGDGFTDLNPFAAGLAAGTPGGLDPGAPDDGLCSIGPTPVYGCHPEWLGLSNPGTATLDGSQVLNAPEDFLDTDVITLYLDAILHAPAGAWTWSNRLFYEAYDHLKEVAYGFSQFHDTWALEYKLVAANDYRVGAADVSLQVSPSLRYTSFAHASDYTNEYFDRRDLTLPAGPLDTRLLATQIDDDYTRYYIGDYANAGLAALADVTWASGFSALAGIRYDNLEMQSRQPVEKLLLPSAHNFCSAPQADCVFADAADRVGGLSWTLSVTYASRLGLIPYATVSRQSTVIAGQGAEITAGGIARGSAFDTSRLREIGVKGSMLDGSLYFALALYRQQRTDYSAQSTVTNQASRTTGGEFELRWVATEKLLLTAGYSDMEVINLNTLQAGGRFSYIGAADVPGVAPESLYGGALAGSVTRAGRQGARRAGMPKSIRSLTGTYDFGNGLAVSASAVDVDAVPSGFSGSVTLPAYTLVNAGLVYEAGSWTFSLTARNITDERYFRANFPNLYGSVIVLPELPRHYQARLQYRW